MARKLYYRMEVSVEVDTDQAEKALNDTFKSCKEAMYEQSKIDGKLSSLMCLEPIQNQLKSNSK